MQDVLLLGLNSLIYVIWGQFSGQSYMVSPILIKVDGIPSIGRTRHELMTFNFEMGYGTNILDKENLTFVCIMVLM